MVKLSMIAAIVAATLPMAARAGDVPLAPGETLLEVQVEGRVRIAPDAAFISMGVVSTGTTAREATEANARMATAVIAAVKATGVDARYIRTQQINVQPRFARLNASDYEGQAQITGYVASNSVAVTVVKLPLASAVITAAFAAGANSVSGPMLGTENRQTGLAEARAAALANAKAQADAYAAGLGMRVGRVLRVSERGQNTQPLEYAYMTGSRLSAVGAPPPPAPSARIEGGQMERSVQLWIDYALVK